MNKKYYVLLGAFSALASLSCLGDYVAQDFTSPRTGQSSVFWADASKGKDAYVLEYDKNTDNYYFKKVEKNKPSDKSDAKEVANEYGSNKNGSTENSSKKASKSNMKL